MTDKNDNIHYFIISNVFDEEGDPLNVLFDSKKNQVFVGETKEQVEEDYKNYGGNPDAVIWMEG